MAIDINISAGIPAGTVVGVPALKVYKRDEFLSILEGDIDQVFIGPDGQDFAEDQETVIYKHGTGEIENYAVIFDNPYASQKVNSEAGYTGVNPQVMLQESKLVRKVRTDDVVTVRGVNYYVKDYQSDGVGVVTLYLRTR